MSEQPPRYGVERTETPAIAPALSADEWAARSIARASGYPVVLAAYGECAEIERVGELVRLDVTDGSWSERNLPALIALANAVLPDSDPRKFTRELELALRVAAVALETDDACFHVDNSTHATAVRRAAAILKSYLPPE